MATITLMCQDTFQKREGWEPLIKYRSSLSVPTPYPQNMKTVYSRIITKDSIGCTVSP